MRIPHRNQLQRDYVPISQIELNTERRHRIVPVLRAQQHVHSQPGLLNRIFGLLEPDVLGDADPGQGREGMTYWQIVVLAAAKAGCKFTYDELQDLAGNHRNLRAMMQVGSNDA